MAPAHAVEDAPLGELVMDLLRAVLKTKKDGKFGPALEKLQSTLRKLEPDIHSIIEVRRKLDPSPSETEEMKILIKSGRKLVLESSSISMFSSGAHKKKLYELDAKIVSYFQVVDMQSEFARFVLKIEEYRKKVFKAPPPHDFPVGLNAHLTKLKQELLLQQGSVVYSGTGTTTVTVTGSPGSGKTMLARMFCGDNLVKGTFNENIFYVTFGSTPNIKSIVEKLHQYNNNGVLVFAKDKDPVDQLKNLLDEIAKKGPILMVLEDVCPGSESLVENFVFQIPNYIILVISRYRCKGQLGSLQVNPLGEQDSKTLFHHSASLNQTTSKIPDDVVNKIVSACSGSPLALKVNGRSLRDNNLAFWQKKADDLSKQGHRILDSENCMLIYRQDNLDFFDPTIMECFKDLALFPEDERIHASALMDLWAELYSEDDNTAKEQIDELAVKRNLARSNIVTRKVASGIYDDYNYYHVSQYSFFRKLAIHQSSLEPVHERNRLIIEINGNNLPAWWSINGYPITARILSISTDKAFSSQWCELLPTEVEVLVLHFRHKNCMLPSFMKKMNKLKILIIKMYDSHAVVGNFNLLAHLSDHLKRLCLENISIPFLSKTGVQLKNLQKCFFYKCNVNKAIQDSTTQVSESDVLLNLLEIDFAYCTMTELPFLLSNCVLLEKMRITNCHQLLALPAGIEKLNKLKLLNLSSCPDLVQLPDSITSLQNLKFLDISHCKKITKLPEDMNKLINLEKLNVRGSGIIKLPELIKDLGNLKVVCDKKMVDRFREVLTSEQLEVAEDVFHLEFLN